MVSKYRRFITDIDSVTEKLQKYGVAVIPNILDEEECQNMISGMWNTLEHITQNMDIPIQRNNSTTWRTFYSLYPKHAMLLQNWDVGQSQFLWDLRQNPKIVDVFAKIWNVRRKELLVSFDGFSVHFPPETTNRGWFNNNWFHSDQSYTRNGFECIQGFVSALDTEDGDASLTVLPKSHKYHKRVAEEFNITAKTDWYKLTPEQQTYYIEELGCKPTSIKCTAGSLVLWDSRTIHCGTEARKGRDTPKMRIVGYVSYMPRAQATQSMLTKKIKAFEDMRTTNHWAQKPKLFPRTPHTYGGELPDIVAQNPPILTNLGRKLAGY